MCAEKYPLRISVTDEATKKSKVVNQDEVITTRQLRSAKTEHFYKLEAEHTRQKAHKQIDTAEKLKSEQNFELETSTPGDKHFTSWRESLETPSSPTEDELKSAESSHSFLTLSPSSPPVSYECSGQTGDQTSLLSGWFEGLLQQSVLDCNPSAADAESSHSEAAQRQRARTRHFLKRWRQYAVRAAHIRSIVPSPPTSQPPAIRIPKRFVIRRQPTMAVATVNISGDGSVFPEKFTGADDGSDWLGKLETFAKYKGLMKADSTPANEHQMMSLLAVLLSDGAKLWHDSLNDAESDTWVHLRKAFTDRFAEQKALKYKHSKAMFTTKQGSAEPVLEYISRIQALAKKSSEAPDVNIIIHAVMAGVKPSVASYLAEHTPTTIADLAKHASIAEATITESELVSAAQFSQLQEEMKAQFNMLSVKIGAGAVANVVEESRSRSRPTSADRRPNRVTFAQSTSRSPSMERQQTTRRYDRFQGERNDGYRNRPYQNATQSRSEGRDIRPQTSQPSSRGWNERSSPQYQNWQYTQQHGNQNTRSGGICYKCGYDAHDDVTQCRARNARCAGCSKIGHYKMQCRSLGANRFSGRGRVPPRKNY